MSLKPLILYCCITFTIFQACSPKTEQSDTTGEQALVNVNGKVLYKYEVDQIVPKGLNQTDSTLAAEAYVKMWIKNELIYEKAEENINDKEKIAELVNNYRQTLTIYTYQEQLLQERLSKTISDKEIEEYYQNNPDKFDLESNIVKGLFLKLPLNAPQLDELKKWYKQTNDKSIENIEKHSLQSAVIYDYFYDKWVDFDGVMNNIPYIVTDSKQFLQNNKSFETQDSSYVYLLNIKEYALVGSKAPFEYAKGQVLDILLNQKKEAFIKKFEDDLYNTAVKNNQIKYYNK